MIQTQYYSNTLDTDNNKLVSNFVSQCIWGAKDKFDKYCTMAVIESCKLIAGVVYHNYYEDAGVIEISAGSISKRWLTKPVLRAMFNMPFLCLNCQMVTCRVSELNTTMLNINRKFGFEEIYIPRARGRHEGEYLFMMTQEAWAKHKVNK